jgi:hypothetical protein
VTWSIYRRIDIDFSLLYDNGPVEKSLCTDVLLAHQETGQLLQKIAAIDRSLFAKKLSHYRSDESMNGRSG